MILGLVLSPANSMFYGGSSSPPPSTQTYSYDDGLPGWGGDKRVNDPTRLYLNQNRSTWVGIITGTDATITARNTSGLETGAITASVDGGPVTALSRSGNVYTIFSGLAQGPHLVMIATPATAVSEYILKTDTFMSVTGAPPSMSTPWAQWRSVGGLAADAFWNIATTTNNSNFDPPVKSPSNGTDAAQQNNPSLSIKTDGTELFIVTNDTAAVWVSIDGGVPTRYPVTNTSGPLYYKQLTGLSGTHVYNVWNDTYRSMLHVGSNGIMYTTTNDKKFDQFGTSITMGLGATTGAPEYFGVAAALGYVGANHGKSGETILGLKTKIDALLAQKTIGANDVCVLEIGENDGYTTALDATKTTNYQYCVSALLAKGYRRVICRATIRDAYGGAQNNLSNSIQSIVAGYADARVKFQPTYLWSGISTGDGLHPNAAGYLTMRGYALADYPALLA